MKLLGQKNLVNIVQFHGIFIKKLNYLFKFFLKKYIKEILCEITWPCKIINLIFLPFPKDLLQEKSKWTDLESNFTEFLYICKWIFKSQALYFLEIKFYFIYSSLTDPLRKYFSPRFRTLVRKPSIDPIFDVLCYNSQF